MNATSPLPPWHRPIGSQGVENIIGDGQISLTVGISYLKQTAPKDSLDASVAYDVVLPDGNLKGQIKRIMVPASEVETTALFRVAGTFSAGFATLKFDGLGINAVLDWDGSGWQLIGGNAITEPSA